MKVDTFRAIFTYVIVVLILAGGFYAIVLYPFELDQLVKGAIITFMGSAVTFVFGQEIAKTTANATTKALHTPAPNVLGEQGAANTLAGPTITAENVTITPPDPPAPAP